MQFYKLLGNLEVLFGSSPATDPITEPDREKVNAILDRLSALLNIRDQLAPATVAELEAIQMAVCLEIGIWERNQAREVEKHQEAGLHRLRLLQNQVRASDRVYLNNALVPTDFPLWLKQRYRTELGAGSQRRSFQVVGFNPSTRKVTVSPGCQWRKLRGFWSTVGTRKVYEVDPFAIDMVSTDGGVTFAEVDLTA